MDETMFIQVVRLFIIIQVIVLAIVEIKSSDNKPLVKTLKGTVQGRYIKSYGGRIVSAFEGIPYAKPPVGELRFKEPEPSEPWSDVLEANNTYVCLQFVPIVTSSGIMGTEDCLYLYIYTPKETISGVENMSVIVHIHGGAFMLGAPKYLAGPDYITDKDVVYVTFNYRLGIMGFLSTEDEVVPGNNGLKDQIMALKWIQDNIKYFGGNPNSVTLTGLSAGGASVHYHYFSPLSKGIFNRIFMLNYKLLNTFKGLFHRGFSQSGTSLNMWALTENPLQKTKKLATFLNCTTETNKDMIGCLKKQPDSHIILTLKKFFIFINAVPYTPFGPVIEKGKAGFLVEHPYKLLVEGKINDCPWITSNTKNEGIYPVGFFVLYGKLQQLDEEWNSIIPSALDYDDTVSDGDKVETAQKLRKHYLNNEQLSTDNLDKLINLFTDRLFLYDSETAVRLHAKASISPVYYYFYEYQMQTKTIFPKSLKGSAHSDDGRMLFKIYGNPEILPHDDQNMKEVLTDFIYKFATTGIPQINGTEWNPVGKNKKINFMHIISPKNTYMDTIEELAPTNFWKNLNIEENGNLLD
ncbi:hypothetical protein RN001_000479 [Aquatica leii]|uniref:Carboxylic ester hydrolase n=1 Tax=Aquatica leii TaxID=1421715 RepID=A0AAN7QM22_9COLE|nr:hypothetical protein RN001_000479 [Aquatica leii]